MLSVLVFFYLLIKSFLNYFPRLSYCSMFVCCVCVRCRSQWQLMVTPVYAWMKFGAIFWSQAGVVGNPSLWCQLQEPVGAFNLHLLAQEGCVFQNQLLGRPVWGKWGAWHQHLEQDCTSQPLCLMLADTGASVCISSTGYTWDVPVYSLLKLVKTARWRDFRVGKGSQDPGRDARVAEKPC